MNTDWVGVLEAAGASAADDKRWARGVVDSAANVFRGRGYTGGVGLSVVRHDATCDRIDLRVIEVNGAWKSPLNDTTAPALQRLGPRVVRAIYYPRATVAVQSDVARELAPVEQRGLRAYRKQAGVDDSLGIIVHPDPGVALVLCGGYIGKPKLTSATRRLLARIGLHLEAGFRLRHRPDALLAVIRPNGKLLHLEQDAPQRETLVARTQSIERARTRSRRTDPDSLELWQAMIDGRASIVERIDGGQRLYFVVENPPAQHRFRALTAEEADTVSRTSRGLSAKLVAYGLGVSESSVSARLASATAKIGLCTRTELIRLAALLTRDPRAPFEDAALTRAERDVLELLQQGLSNGEIARARHRSVNTIANQVAQLLKKTGAATRRALAARA